MRLLDRFTSKFLQRNARAEVPPKPGDPDVFTPQFANRETRRRYGFRKPIGLINAEHEGLVVFDEPYLPRFVRRHFAQATGDLTRRRNRKARARVARLMKPIAPAGSTWS